MQVHSVPLGDTRVALHRTHKFYSAKDNDTLRTVIFAARCPASSEEGDGEHGCWGRPPRESAGRKFVEIGSFRDIYSTMGRAFRRR